MAPATPRSVKTTKMPVVLLNSGFPSAVRTTVRMSAGSLSPPSAACKPSPMTGNLQSQSNVA